MLKFLKRPFCKHEKTEYVGSFKEEVSPGRFRVRHIWKCKNCGKEMIGGK